MNAVAMELLIQNCHHGLHKWSMSLENGSIIYFLVVVLGET